MEGPASQPLTIALDADQAKPAVARLGAALSRLGHRIVIVGDRSTVNAIERAGGSASLIADLPRWLGPWWRRRRFEAVAQARADVVHLIGLRAHHTMWLAPGSPALVATPSPADLDRREGSAAADRARAELLTHAHAVSADTPALLRLAEQRMGANPAPRRVVYWAPDLAPFERDRAAPIAARLRQQLDIPPGARVLLSPRPSLTDYHIDRIVAAFAMTRWSHTGVLVLRTLGLPEEPSYQRFILELAGRRRVKDRVRICPPLAADELAGLYAIADAAIALPTSDGIAPAYLELMAMGVPIVAWNLGAYAGVFESRSRGAVLAATGDIGEVNAALTELHDDRDLCQRIGAAGSIWARNNADWPLSVAAWVDLYREAIAARAAG